MIRHRWSRFVSQLLIGTLVLPMSLLQGLGSASAAEDPEPYVLYGGSAVLNEISPDGDWVELYNPADSTAMLADGAVRISTASGASHTMGAFTMAPHAFLTIPVVMSDTADVVTLSMGGGVITQVSWGNSLTAQLPAPTSTGHGLARTIDGAGAWISNADATPGMLNDINLSDVPATPTALAIPASTDNAAGSITATTADDVSVHFSVTGTVDHLAAHIGDANGLWTALEQDLATNALVVDGIDTTALIDGAVTLHGYARNNGLLSAWAQGAATKATNVISAEEAPAAPTNMAVLLDSTNRAIISWTESTTLGIDAYRIYANNGSGDVTLSTALATVADNTETYTTTALSAGTWKFLVRAVKNDVESTNTSPVIMTVAGPVTDTTAPTVPTNLLATSLDGQVKLTWATVSDAAGYHLRYREATNKGDDGYTTLFAAGQATAEVTVKNLTNGILYEFGLAAEDAAGNRSDFAVAEQTPMAAGNAGSNFVVPSTSTRTGAITPTSTPKATVTHAAAPTTVRTSTTTTPTTIAPAPIGGQVDEPVPTVTDDTAEPRPATDDAAQTDTTRTLVTILIIIIAAAAGFGGYYGYQWWVSRPEEVTTDVAPTPAEPKKPKRHERGGRW